MPSGNNHLAHQHSASNVGGDTRDDSFIIMNSVSISNLSTVCLKCPLTRMGNSILYILKNAQDFQDIQEK